MVKLPDLTMMEAMNALVMLDPRMDSGCSGKGLEDNRKAEAELDSLDLSPAVVCEIMDRLLRLEVGSGQACCPRTTLTFSPAVGHISHRSSSRPNPLYITIPLATISSHRFFARRRDAGRPPSSHRHPIHACPQIMHVPRLDGTHSRTHVRWGGFYQRYRWPLGRRERVVRPEARQDGSTGCERGWSGCARVRRV